MPQSFHSRLSSASRSVLLASLTMGALASCGPAPAPTGINDPKEAENREVHEANKAVDKFFVRPVSEGVSHVQPGPLRRGLSNFAKNLAVPNDIVNNILQLRLGKAVENTVRFAVNSTLGLGGLVDVSTAAGLPEQPTDFGETLHVWGFGEGNYVELPVLGPSTERDMFGRIGDLVLDPIWYVLPTGEALAAYGLVVVDDLNYRDRYKSTIDSILYESADSYAQARLLYLQNRRYTLGQTTSSDGANGFEDPYADDSFIDPYEDSNGN